MTESPETAIRAKLAAALTSLHEQERHLEEDSDWYDPEDHYDHMNDVARLRRKLEALRAKP